MSADTCGFPHPERPEVVCDRAPHDMRGFHRERASGEVWEGEPLPDLRRRGRVELAAMAERTARPERTGLI